MSGDGRFAAALAEVECGVPARVLAAMPRLVALGDERARRVMAALARDADPVVAARARAALAALERAERAFDENPAPRYLAARVGSAAALADEAVFLYRRRAGTLAPLALLVGLPKLFIGGNLAGWLVFRPSSAPAALVATGLLFALHALLYRPFVWAKLAPPLLAALGETRPAPLYGDLLAASFARAAAYLATLPFALWFAASTDSDGGYFLSLAGLAIAGLAAYSASCLVLPLAALRGAAPAETYAALFGGLFRVVNHVATPFLLFQAFLLAAFGYGAATVADTLAPASGWADGALFLGLLGALVGDVLSDPFWIAYHLLLARAAEVRP